MSITVTTMRLQIASMTWVKTKVCVFGLVFFLIAIRCLRECVSWVQSISLWWMWGLIWEGWWRGDDPIPNSEFLFVLYWLLTYSLSVLMRRLDCNESVLMTRTDPKRELLCWISRGRSDRSSVVLAQSSCSGGRLARPIRWPRPSCHRFP